VSHTISTTVYLDFVSRDDQPLFSRSASVELKLPADWEGGGKTSFKVTVPGVNRRFCVPVELRLPDRAPAEGESMRLRFRPPPYRLDPEQIDDAGGGRLGRRYVI
jgi:hypothetical protein